MLSRPTILLGFTEPFADAPDSVKLGLSEFDSNTYADNFSLAEPNLRKHSGTLVGLLSLCDSDANASRTLNDRDRLQPYPLTSTTSHFQVSANCSAAPPFEGDAKCVDGEWVVTLPPGPVSVNTTISVPVRIVGNLTLNNQSIIRFRITNAAGGPLIVVDGHLGLGA